MLEIGKRIQELRAYMYMSQVEFANRLGVTNSHISKIEKGKTVPSEALIKLICKEFGIIEKWLKNGEGEMNKEITEDVTGENLSISSENISILLRSESIEIRLITSKIEFFFSEILLLDTSKEIQLKYLVALEPFFYALNKYLTLLKQSSIDKDITLNEVDSKQISRKYTESINTQLKDIEAFFKNV